MVEALDIEAHEVINAPFLMPVRVAFVSSARGIRSEVVATMSRTSRSAARRMADGARSDTKPVTRDGSGNPSMRATVSEPNGMDAALTVPLVIKPRFSNRTEKESI